MDLLVLSHLEPVVCGELCYLSNC